MYTEKARERERGREKERERQRERDREREREKDREREEIIVYLLNVGPSPLLFISLLHKSYFMFHCTHYIMLHYTSQSC